MLPVLALVGRPNVGKSTLFNYLTRTRDAIVADFPGLTRDRIYGLARRTTKPYWIIDTGGITDEQEGISHLAKLQVEHALQEADAVLFLVDGRDGLSAGDHIIGERLRSLSKPIYLVVNKIDGVNESTAVLDFHTLGLGQPWPISASHGMGIPNLLEALESHLPSETNSSYPEFEGIRIAVVGRPNVGKSTLVNRLLGEDRVVVFDQPGTTRDSVYVPFERDEQKYVLIDTAGIRRRARVHETIEKFSVVKALQAIERAHVVIYLIDAREGVTDQDAHLLGTVCEAGKALIVGLNKWDGMDVNQRNQVRRMLDVKLGFLDFAQKHVLSALHGSGVGTLFDELPRLYEAAMRDLPTPLLTRILLRSVEQHQPPLVRGRRVKLKYAHQGGHNPPSIIIHGNQTDELPIDYKRYLTNVFRSTLRLEGTPLRLEFKSPDNPFEGRRNTLTPRQIHKRRRLMRFVKRSKS